MRLPLLSLSLLVFVQCTQSQVDKSLADYDIKKVPYKINAPSRIISLHYDLEEISGLSYYNTTTLLAVQDEKGKLYFIDSDNGDVKQELKFGKSGDYEGVELRGEVVYVFASNGKLISFRLEGSEVVENLEIKTEFSGKNDIEGLGSVQGKLITICKASGEVGKNDVKGKAGYFFNENSDQGHSLAFSFKIKELEKFINDRPYFNELKDFDPSGIAEHPITRDVYIISADRAMLVLSPDFQIKELVKLDRKIYKQAEGICFSPDGTLFISNEGDGARAKLIKLDYIRP